MTQLAQPRASYAEHLTRAVQLYGDNFWPLVSLSAATALLTLMLSFWNEMQGNVPSITGMVLSVVTGCVHIFISQMLVYKAANAAQGETVAMSAVMGHVGQRFSRILGAHFLFALILIVGCILLILPGLYAMTVLCFFSYGILLEDQTVVQSFKRSFELVKGAFWRIFGANALVTLVTLLLLVLCMLPLMLMGFSKNVIQLFISVLGALTMPVFVGFYYFLYAELKAEKDGVINISVYQRKQ